MKQQHKGVAHKQTLLLLSCCFRSCSEKQSGQLVPKLAASVTCGSQAAEAWGSLWPPHQAGGGPGCLAAWLLLVHWLLSLSCYLASFSFYASVGSLWPPLFSLCHSFIPPSRSSFQSVRHNPKGFVLESCSLVLSGTYSLTPLALFQPVSLSHLH